MTGSVACECGWARVCARAAQVVLAEVCGEEVPADNFCEACRCLVQRYIDSFRRASGKVGVTRAIGIQVLTLASGNPEWMLKEPESAHLVLADMALVVESRCPLSDAVARGIFHRCFLPQDSGQVSEEVMSPVPAQSFDPYRGRVPWWVRD